MACLGEFLLFLCVTIVSVCANTLPYKIESRILKRNDSSDGTITHLVHDGLTNTFYIGAVNRLFKLSASLEIQQLVSTGPKLDNYFCADKSNCERELEYTDNYNKILLIEHNINRNNRLVVCGSLFQGYCEFHDLQNISISHPPDISLTQNKLVANDGNGSSVGLIVRLGVSENVMYIGASYPINIACTASQDDAQVFFTARQSSPALSMRKLTDSDTFSLYQVAKDFPPKPASSLQLKNDFIRKYLIDYVSAFSVGNYSYFLSVQPDYSSTDCVDQSFQNSQPSQSKISLTCNSDTNFYSYVDIPLKCLGNNIDYSLVKTGQVITPGQDLRNKMRINDHEDKILVTIFQKRKQSGQIDSAVCVYSISNIQKVMLDNIDLCMKGNTSQKGDRFVEGASCTQATYIGSGPTLCNTLNKAYGRVSGIVPAQVKPAIVFQNTELTSITLTTTSNFTVAFLGTAKGHLKKILIDNQTLAKEYDQDLVIDEGSPINHDTVYEPTNRQLYLASQRLVAKVQIENCRQYTSCTTCLASKDPFCGWCTLENSCTLKSECMGSDKSADRWKILTACTAIDSISPPMASSTEDITLYLSIIDIPRGTDYSCVFDFGQKQQTTNVSSWNFGISCKTPQISLLGINFGPTGSKNATLSIRSEETEKLFVSKQFTFYDCGSFTSCSSCTNNNYACDWCVYENKCTFRTNPCQSLTIFSRNVHNYDPGNFTQDANFTQDQIYGDGIKKGPVFCPKIDRSLTGKLFIHNNTSQEIVVRGSYFPPLQSNSGSKYECIIETGAGNGNIIAVGQRESESLLRCQIPQTTYSLPPAGIYEAPLTIRWGQGASEVESDGATVSIYSCRKMAQGDCSLCKNFEDSRPSLNCRWCDNPLRCEYRAHCTGAEPVTMCPAPQIESVSPVKGHILGGTSVTIKGRNLGAKFTDIEHNVTIAGVACAPVSELYKPAREIVCTLGPSNAGVKRGPVVVLNTPLHHFEFQYLEPILTNVHPSWRAKSGGALLTMHGNPIYIDTSIAIKVNDNSCNITSKTEREVICRLPAGSRGVAKLSVLIDGQEIRRNTVGNTSFEYVEDPTITSISPLQSFQSGGRSLTVKGTNINIIDHPKMFIQKNYIRSNLTRCSVKNATCMFCPTPRLPDAIMTKYKLLRRSTELITAQIGFIMDNVANVQDLSNYQNLQSGLQYFPDPEVMEFESDDRVKVFKSEILVINGNNLLVAAKREDVQVFIGDQECNVTNLSEDQIVCNPPSSQPGPKKIEGKRSDIPAVLVHIGNRQYFVGYLEYESDKILGIPMGIIIGAVSGVGLFIVVTIIVCCCIYKRQKNKSRRDFEKMRYQLDNLESTVRNECKQAFAELQTDMTDLTADIGDGKKPLYRYDDFTFKILFPQMLDHVVLHPPIPKNGNNERHPDVAICHFSQLLQNKQFLLKFIRTLEKQKSFGIRDKSNVASLLIILYQNNLEYITEIIKALLIDLVEKSVEGKHPKLMLRRTESVVEKLLANWLSLCMYKNVEESTGSSLYLLYQAIKFQVMKGPVDAVTGDARYSLSEDRLLRTENRLEPVTLTLNVEYEGKKYKCRCLDCDTITQAKEKMLDVIYRNIPYSTRPAAEDLDLDWINENKTLQDEDNTKWKENGWKQLNMLKDYKIPNGADVVLTQYQKCRTLPRSPNGSVHSSGFSYREAVPITRTDSEVSTKYWHLIKQHDDAQTKGLSSEIYLTRLLATKGTLKQYIDDFIKTVLTASPNIIPVIKYLFDFLDDAARQHNITDPEVAYTWKCNSLLLRFWVNIIKNPDFVFDIHKTNIVDSCLSVVAQCFMDSCSTSDQNLSKDSPSNKLLFAKDIPVFKRWVSKYFDDIQRMPAISDQDLNAYLAEVSRMSTNYFTKDNALFELYNYVQKYSNEINESLEADSFTKAQQLPDRLGTVITNMEGPSHQAMAYV